MQNYKSLFQKIFIVYATFTVEIKAVWDLFIKVFYDDHLSKTTTFEWFQE